MGDDQKSYLDARNGRLSPSNSGFRLTYDVVLVTAEEAERELRESNDPLSTAIDLLQEHRFSIVALASLLIGILNYCSSENVKYKTIVNHVHVTIADEKLEGDFERIKDGEESQSEADSTTQQSTTELLDEHRLRDILTDQSAAEREAMINEMIDSLEELRQLQDPNDDGSSN